MALPALIATLAPVLRDVFVEIIELVSKSSDPEDLGKRLLTHTRALAALEGEARRRER